jgi:lysozyme
VRQEVIVNMAFNMGIVRLGGFKKFIASLVQLNFSAAASEMQNSAWFSQVGNRGIRLVYAMRNGAFQ